MRLIQYLVKEFRLTLATHKRARDVIARYDETNQRADDVSRKTRELLFHHRK